MPADSNHHDVSAGQVRAVYRPIAIAWPGIVLAPLAIVTVAVILIVRAVAVPGDAVSRIVPLVWSAAVLVGMPWLASRTVIRADLTDHALRWRTLTSAGELPLTAIRSIRSSAWSRSVTLDAGDRRLRFGRGRATADLAADLRRAAPHIEVELSAASTRESMLDPYAERHLKIERPGMFTYRRIG
jgi:hypothetical protein